MTIESTTASHAIEAYFKLLETDEDFREKIVATGEDKQAKRALMQAAGLELFNAEDLESYRSRYIGEDGELTEEGLELVAAAAIGGAIICGIAGRTAGHFLGGWIGGDTGETVGQIIGGGIGGAIGSIFVPF